MMAETIPRPWVFHGTTFMGNFFVDILRKRIHKEELRESPRDLTQKNKNYSLISIF